MTPPSSPSCYLWHREAIGFSPTGFRFRSLLVSCGFGRLPLRLFHFNESAIQRVWDGPCEV
jgi:hypothetical protein